VDKVRQLYDEHGVSTVLVVGGSGDYFPAAGSGLLMDEYLPVDVTAEAKRIARDDGGGRTAEGGETFGAGTPRIISPDSFDASRGHREKVDAKGLQTILYGTHEIALSQVEQLVDPSQTRAIARMMQELAKQTADSALTLREQIDRLHERIGGRQLDSLGPHRGRHPRDLAPPRRFALAAAVNRLRTLRARAADRRPG